MKEIRLSELGKHIQDIENIEQGDLLLTKRNKPFAVVVEYKHYLNMTTKKRTTQEDRLELLQEIKGTLDLRSLRE
jgi:hypothetical protein